MLFVAQFKSRGHTPVAETTARRTNWQPPATVKLIAEYWCTNSSMGTVVVFESDDADALSAITQQWLDDYEIEVSPAVTGEHGMELARDQQ